MSQDERAFNWDSIPVKTGVTADPAAGANWATITVPAGKKWLVQGFFTGLVCAVAAADRYIAITIAHDGTNTDEKWSTATAQTTGLTRYYSWVPVPAEINLANLIMIEPFQPCELMAGATIICTISNKDAGDNAEVMRYYYKEVPI